MPSDHQPEGIGQKPQGGSAGFEGMVAWRIRSPSQVSSCTPASCALFAAWTSWWLSRRRAPCCIAAPPSCAHISLF